MFRAVARASLPRFLLLLVVWSATIGQGCQEDALRVPYIPPTLANWPTPYHGVAGLKLHVFNTGSMRVPEALLLHGGSLTRTRDLPVPAYAIAHPKQGLILFNTGLSPKASEESASSAAWMRLLAGAEVVHAGNLASQLQEAGLKVDDVRWVVLSNLELDHTGGLKRFPQARVVVTKAEQDYARERHSGYAPADFDDVANWKFIDFSSPAPLATFPTSVDLFGDGSCLLIDAKGATPGAMAMIVRLPHRPVVLADDMAAVPESLRYAAQPASAYDMAEWWDHIWRLKRFKDLAPDLVVMPGHDLAAAHASVSHDIVVHESSAPTPAPQPAATPNLLRQLIPAPM